MNQTEKDFYLLMRRSKKINQKELADHLGVSQTLISMFETNFKEMTKHHIEKYKKYILDK
jgi:transcriptional regulator with XRE-family HTH domain